MQKILDTIISVLKFVGKIFDFLPEKFKGYRTIAVNGILFLLGALEKLDIVHIFSAICDFLNFIHIHCTSDGVFAIYAMVVAFINAALRAVTNTPVGEGTPS